jgi:hypothetical protein
VVDSKTQHLMTERDLIAFGNLRILAKSGGPPQAYTFSRDRLEKSASLLNSLFGDGKNSQHLDMPPLWAIAAGFWMGVEREWSGLDGQQRQAVKTFIQSPTDLQKVPKADLYGRLLGLSPQEAASFAREYHLEASSAGMHNMAMNTLRGLGSYLNTMALIDGILGPN